jgi:drug/metabolite transporter (DMT)-like permease
VLAIFLALSASVVWGAADFLGGLQARQRALLTVLLWMQGSATVAALLYVLASGEALPGGPGLWWALMVGVSGCVAVTAFYRALAIGTMSIVAPLAALGAIGPVMVGLLADGERPGALQAAGIALAGAGVVLSAREPAGGERARNARLAVGLALIAAVGMGASLTSIERGSAAIGVPWTLLIGRGVSAAVFLALVLALRPSMPSGPRDAAPLVVVGVLDVAANALFAFATTLGLLSVVGVLGSLFPAVTVILARVVLREKVTRAQEAGVIAVLVGVVAVSAG